MAKWKYPTTYLTISDDMGYFELWDLLHDDKTLHQKPCLTIKKGKAGNLKDWENWDNEEYVESFFKTLKNNKQHPKLIKICEKLNLPPKETRKTLLSIYKRSKNLGMWKTACKHVRVEGASCRLNNGCKYPNCL